MSGVTDGRNGELVRTTVAPLDCDWTSGVVERNMLMRLLPMLLKVSLSSFESCCCCGLVVSTEVAREAARGRDPEKRVLRVETAMEVLGDEACERTERSDIDGA